MSHGMKATDALEIARSCTASATERRASDALGLIRATQTLLGLGEIEAASVVVARLRALTRLPHAKYDVDVRRRQQPAPTLPGARCGEG
jgi:hypothetical protein